MDGSTHGRNEDFGNFILVGEGETSRVGGKGWRLLGDVADEPTFVWVIFRANGWVSVCDYWERDIVVDVIAEGKICGTVLYKVDAGRYGELDVVL